MQLMEQHQQAAPQFSGALEGKTAEEVQAMVDERNTKIARLDEECARMAEYVDSVTAVLMEHDPALLQEANKRRIDKAQARVLAAARRVDVPQGESHPAQGAYEHGSQKSTPQQTPEVTRKAAGGKAPPPILSSTEAHKKGWFGKK